MKYSVDRIEGKYAVLQDENGGERDVLFSYLPAGAKEGSVLLENEDGSFTPDPDEEAARKKRLQALQDSLFLK